MKTLNHPNLVKMLGVCIEKSPFYLVQVLAETYSKLAKVKVLKMSISRQHLNNNQKKINAKLEKICLKKNISICRSCAAMEIFGTIWSLLSLWRLWARWATNWAGWTARCWKVMSRLKICTSLNFVWSQYFRAGKTKRSLRMCQSFQGWSAGAWIS